MNLEQAHRDQLEILSEFLQSELAETLATEATERKVVCKLKNEPGTVVQTIFDIIVDRIDFLEDKVMSLEAENYQQRDEIRVLVKAVDTITKNSYEANNELSSVKVRYGIY